MKKEVDACEADKEPSEALVNFQKALNVPAVQLIEEGETFRLTRKGQKGLLVAPACQWLALLP